MRRTKEDAGQTRDAILNAALEKFSQKGVRTTTLSEIAQGAGVTRGAIYWHFKDKRDIFDALHENAYIELSQILAEGKEREHSNPMKSLEETCIAFLRNVEETPQIRQWLTLFWLKADYEDEWSELKEKHQARKAQGAKLFPYYVMLAHEKNMLPADTSPEILAKSVGCYLKGIIFENLVDPERFSLTKEGTSMMKQFFEGLAKR